MRLSDEEINFIRSTYEEYPAYAKVAKITKHSVATVKKYVEMDLAPMEDKEEVVITPNTKEIVFSNLQSFFQYLEKHPSFLDE